jgi:hypothetical protein
LPTGRKTVKPELEMAKKEAQDILIGLKIVPLTQEEARELRKMHQIVYTWKNPIDTMPQDDYDLMNRYVHLLLDHEKVAGTRCDFCNKSEVEIDIKKWRKCAKCEKTYYCSNGCQNKHWNAGHRKSCRRLGQIQPGDIMIIRQNSEDYRNAVDGK